MVSNLVMAFDSTHPLQSFRVSDMANEENLTHKLTVSEQRAGGKASGEARRKKKLMREAFEELLSRDYHDHAGNVLDGTSALAAKVFKQAMDGDLKAFEIIRDTVGQKPVEKIEVDTIDPQARAEMDELLGLGD